MLKHLPIWLIAAGCCTGCSSAFTTRPHVAEHCHPVAVIAGQVRTGGDIAYPTVFPLDVDRVLTLRQALLQSGGIKSNAVQPQATTVWQPMAVSAQPQPASNASEAQSPAVDVVKELMPFLGDEVAMNQLLAPVQSGRFAAFASSVGYALPIETEEVAFLRAVVFRTKAAAQLSQTTIIEDAKINSGSNDKVDLLKSLRYIFEQSKGNSPDFAARGLLTIDKVIAALEVGGTKTPVNTTAAGPSVQYVVPASTTKDSIVMLIGIENMRDSYLDRQTTYFHPDLIFKTAVGDVPLRDGDFVFAIRADATSLPRNLAVQHETSSPVLGVSAEFNAIDPTDFSQIEQVVQLKRNALRESGELATIEDVCVLTRQHAGTLTRQVFYFPIHNESLQHPSPELGTVTPGDSFRFVLASRSPFVLDRLLEPIQDKMSARVINQQRKDARLESLPAGSRLVTKVNSTWKFYTRPIVESARNIVK